MVGGPVDCEPQPGHDHIAAAHRRGRVLTLVLVVAADPVLVGILLAERGRVDDEVLEHESAAAFGHGRAPQGPAGDFPQPPEEMRLSSAAKGGPPVARVKVRTGMPSVALDKAEFARRMRRRFYDPAFATTVAGSSSTPRVASAESTFTRY